MFDPSKQEFKEYPIPGPRSGAHGLAEDKDGNIWFGANWAGYVGKLDPKTGELIKGDVATQTRAVLDAMKYTLEYAGSSLDKVLKTTIFITNAPATRLPLEAVLVVARVRSQIELLFKLWKSHGRIDESRSGKAWRVICHVYAKMLVMIVQQWIWLISRRTIRIAVCQKRPDSAEIRLAGPEDCGVSSARSRRWRRLCAAWRRVVE